MHGDVRMNIKEIREMTGQTQREFAESFGIPLGTLRRWEYGESTPAPYIIALIADKLPLRTASMQKIESANGTYYYDKEARVICDIKGTRIKINEDVADVNKQNLAIYASTLFESYYDAVARFDRDCRIDKNEGIIWG